MPWGRPKVTSWRPAEALSAVQRSVQCRVQCSAEISAGLEGLLEVVLAHTMSPFRRDSGQLLTLWAQVWLISYI